VPKVSDVLSAIAVVVAIISLVVSQRTQSKQETASRTQTNQALLLQLRAEYPHISSLAEHSIGSTELEASLAVATNLLHRLRHEADGADFFFIGDTYRHDGFPEQAVPLYREAIAKLSQPAPKIAALRGLGYAEAILEHAPAADEAMHRAEVVNETASYPQPVKVQNKVNTLRVWVTVATTVHDCQGVLRHAKEYFSLLPHLKPPNFAQGKPEMHEVAELATRCRRRH
jgi:hypothetical protein